MKQVFIIFLFCLVLFGCSTRPDAVYSTFSSTKLIIWDPEHFLQLEPLASLTADLSGTFDNPVIIQEKLSENTTDIIETEFSNIPPGSLCIFMVISGRTGFHISTEWNIWMPELWRALDCKGKILIADAPWADEYLNPLKTAKENSIWVINGKLGELRKKLAGSMLAASCRFDEVNILSSGTGSEKRIPLFSYYFFENLKREKENRAAETDLAALITHTAELTATARERGVVSDLEETMFFNRSEVHRDEFKRFPNPVIWNGLADKIILRQEK